MLKYVRISPRTERSILEAWDAGARCDSPVIDRGDSRLRQARLSQSEIIALLKVSKSTVYRHTKDKVRRMRVVSPRRRDGEVREHQLRYG